MGIEMFIPSADAILKKIDELVEERDRELKKVRSLYKIEISRYRAILKVAALAPPSAAGNAVEIDGDVDEVVEDVEGD